MYEILRLLDTYTPKIAKEIATSDFEKMVY